jgi:branched-chain amino acid transport system ATP-binding protein
MSEQVVGLSLSLRGVSAGYGSIEVLHGIDLEVEAGQVAALLGPNGAGKSTALRVLSGRMAATEGQVAIGGEVVRKPVAERLVRRGLCCIPEGRGVFANLTVDEHMWMWTYRGGVDRARLREDVFSRFPELGTRRKQLAGSLSGGERQMLSMSRALCPGVKALLCDELSMGLAPKVVSELFEFVRELAARGVTVLVVEQFAHTALSIASTAAVLVEGRIRLRGTPSEVEAEIGRAYLGEASTVARGA